VSLEEIRDAIAPRRVLTRWAMKTDRVVRCSAPDCPEPATHKIAAPWSDGRFTELKTYGFACLDHVRDILRRAETRWLDYEPVPGEKVYEIGIYRFEPGKSDRQLERDRELEDSLLL
jgi:hypothetical protein